MAISAKIKYKLCRLANKVTVSQAPKYIADRLQKYVSNNPSALTLDATFRDVFHDAFSVTLLG